MTKKKTFFLLLTLLVLAAANIWLVTQYRQRNMDSFLAAYLDKSKALAETKSPKIIIVGGSSAVFGYRSNLIQQRTGLPVVNTGLQGGVGIRFYLNAIEPYIGEGDIILISPEYHNFTNHFSGPDTLLQLLIIDPASLRYISSLEEVLKLIKVIPAVHTQAIKNLVLDDYFHCKTCFKEEAIYFRAAFDQNGDYIFGKVEPEYTSTPFIVDVSASRKNYQDQINVLNRFAAYARSKGAQVVLAYPPTTRFGNAATADYLAALDATLRRELTFPVVGTPADSQFDSLFMFDTYYHLNANGSVIHTNRVLDELCALDLSLTCTH